LLEYAALRNGDWMSNKQIKELISFLEARIHAARSSDDILAAIAKAKAFRKPIAYDHSKYILATAVCAIIGVIVALSPHISFLPSWSEPGNQWMLYLAIVCFVISLIMVTIVFSARKKVTDIAALAYKKDAMLDNNLKYKAPFNSEEMRIRFSELNRGNHSRHFKEVVGGEFKGEDQQFSFEYYHFHYVDKRTVTTRQGKRMRTKTVYDKYDRYGIIVPFGYCKSLQIFSFRPSQLYKLTLSSGSIAFDKTFKIRASDELAATKFLKPAVVVAISDMAGFLSQMNIEIDATGLMCLSFSDRNMIMGNQRYDLSDPASFYDELAGQTSLRKLDRTLRFLHQLFKHSDNNFKDIT
jgi:hypothetical protein